MSADPGSGDAPALAHIVAQEFRRRLLGELLPRIRRCVGQLGDERVWQRPGRTGNSVGNLVLHLAGNTTQWILVPFTGIDDGRQRATEFAAEGGRTGAELCALLENVWTEACHAVDRAPVAALLAPRTIQGYDETGLSAVLHVLEHSAGHAYQIYAWTKQVCDVDLRFYDL